MVNLIFCCSSCLCCSFAGYVTASTVQSQDVEQPSTSVPLMDTTMKAESGRQNFHAKYNLTFRICCSILLRANFSFLTELWLSHIHIMGEQLGHGIFYQNYFTSIWSIEDISVIMTHSDIHFGSFRDSRILCGSRCCAAPSDVDITRFLIVLQECEAMPCMFS